MKRILCLTLVLLLTLSALASLSSCEKTDTPTPTTSQTLTNTKDRWHRYYNLCNAVNIPHSAYVDPDGKPVEQFIRCMYSVYFDNGQDYEGVYVYDIYLHDDDTGTLYFHHLIGDVPGDACTYTLLQTESIPLTAEVGLDLIVLMSEMNFENQPTWNPEEKMGFDGGTTYVYGRNSFGENLIVMWDAREPQPHYYIRKAIEDLVRAHITVEEGIVYRPELYE